jgi:hypothetical protein
MPANLGEKYYTGREVQQILSITEPSLRNLVNQKKIRKIIPPGRKNGLYLKTEVDRYAEKWFAFLVADELPQIAFLTAKPEDMDAVYELAKRSIAPVTMNAATRRAWLDKNPESCFVVKHNKEVVAFFHLLPLEHTRLMMFMDGKIRGWDIKGDDVESFEPGKPVECLAIVASEPDVGETQRMHYMLVLLRGMAKALEDMGCRGMVITKTYATSETPTGIAMAMHIGMKEQPPRIGKRIRFELDTKEGQSFLLQRYKEGLEEWKKSHDKSPRHKERVASK